MSGLAPEWFNNNLLKCNYSAIAIDTCNDRMYLPPRRPNYGLCIRAVNMVWRLYSREVSESLNLTTQTERRST